MATREQVLGSRELSGRIKTFADNSRNEMFTNLFRKGKQIVSFDPNRFEWDERTFSEKLAPVTGLTDAPPVMEMPGEKNKFKSMVKVAHVIKVPASRLFYEREVGQIVDNAQSVVDDVLLQGLNRTKKTVELLCTFALLDTFVINSTTVPGSKVSFGNNGDWGCDTITATDWSDVNTLIASQKVKAICDQFRQNSGLLASQIYINSTTEGYLLENKEIQTLLSSFNGAYAVLQSSHKGTQVMNGLGIGDMLWQKHLGGYKKDGTTWSDFLPTDKAVILPEDGALPDVLAMAEGYNLIPSRLWGTGGDAAQQLMKAPSPGYSVYTELKSKPFEIEFVFEWLGSPAILFPKACLVASV